MRKEDQLGRQKLEKSDHECQLKKNGGMRYGVVAEERYVVKKRLREFKIHLVKVFL